MQSRLAATVEEPDCIHKAQHTDGSSTSPTQPRSPISAVNHQVQWVFERLLSSNINEDSCRVLKRAHLEEVLDYTVSWANTFCHMML